MRVLKKESRLVVETSCCRALKHGVLSGLRVWIGAFEVMFESVRGGCAVQSSQREVKRPRSVLVSRGCGEECPNLSSSEKQLEKQRKLREKSLES